MHSLSIIYYPAAGKVTVGHFELEVDGTSWNLVPLIKSKVDSKNLVRMIERANIGNGYSFFRIHMIASDDEVTKLAQMVISKEGRSIICTEAALKPLSRTGIYHVPLPFRISPCFSALYLILAKQLGSKRISKVEFYGSSSLVTDVARSALGVLAEINLMNVVRTAFEFFFWEGKSIQLLFSFVQIAVQNR